MKTSILKIALLFFLGTIYSVESYAQSVSLKKEVRDNRKDKDNDKKKEKEKDKKDKDKGKKSIPIDGGIGVLLAAGVALGANKFIKRNRESHSSK